MSSANSMQPQMNIGYGTQSPWYGTGQGNNFGMNGKGGGGGYGQGQSMSHPGYQSTGTQAAGGFDRISQQIGQGKGAPQQQGPMRGQVNPVNNRMVEGISAWNPPQHLGQDIAQQLQGPPRPGTNTGVVGPGPSNAALVASLQGGMGPGQNTGVVGPQSSPMNPYGNTNPYIPGGVTDQVNAMRSAQRPGFNPLGNEGYR